MKKDKVKFVIIIFTLIIIDQIIKYFININNTYMPISIIKNVLQINFIQNFGIAFGFARDSKSIFVIANFIIIGVILKFLFTQSKSLNNIKKGLLAIIVAGGIGNLIDRIFRGYVVDYIDITPIINYPVFNFADILIVVGIVCFAIYVIKDIIDENKENIKK